MREGLDTCCVNACEDVFSLLWLWPHDKTLRGICDRSHFDKSKGEQSSSWGGGGGLQYDNVTPPKVKPVWSV